MNRRNFIIKSGLVSGMLLSQRSCLSSFARENKRMGYQLYSIRDEMDKDPFATLKMLTSVGYNDFEVHGYNPSTDEIYGINPSDFSRIIRDLGATVSSGHFGFHEYLDRPLDDLNRFIDACIKTSHLLENNYMVYPWLAPHQRTIDDYKKLAEHLNIIGERAKKANLSCAYHNHDFEFHDHNGDSGYEIILRETDPSIVNMQMDMYWVMHSSPLSPKEWIDTYPGRFHMWHIKDMEKQTRDFTELGNGSIDYSSILPDPKESGLVHFFIEQDGNYTENSKESAKTSAIYFKEKLYSEKLFSY